MSTPTPSMGRRIVRTAIVAMALALLVANVAVYVALHAGLLSQAVPAQEHGRLLAVQAVTSLGALTLAAVVLLPASRFLLKPLHGLTAAARRTAAGPKGERLDPDRPDTDLGQIALAFDEMLDIVEAGLKVAAKLERRSGTFETRWRQVLEAAQEAYLAVDPAGLIVDMNRRAEELFHGSREYFRGRSAGDLVPDKHRDELVATVADIAQRGLMPDSGPYELHALTRTGRRFPAECTVWSVDRRGGTVVHAFVRDITERRDAQVVSARLAAVIDGSSDAIITEDLQGTIRTWNRAAQLAFGWSAEEAVGQYISLLLPEAELPRHRGLLEQIAREDGVIVGYYEGECLTRVGTTVPASVRLSPIRDARNVVVGVSAVVRDITEQRWMSETLDASLAALQVAVDEAQASEETTRRFLADAAHQLRTPMAGISACAETLLRGIGPEDADRLLATMVRETSRAAELISSLLHIARLDQGLPVQREPVDVVALCRDEVERLSLLSPDLAVDLEVRDDVDACLGLDRARCQELLSDLGDNALRHAQSRIAIVVEPAEHGVRIRVADDGPGIPEDARERVFERFVSLDGHGGSGLGLSIARALARSMGGDVRYEGGFVVELAGPADDAEETGRSAAAS